MHSGRRFAPADWLGVRAALEHDIDWMAEPRRSLHVLPTQKCIEVLLIQREQIKNRKAHEPSSLFERTAKSRANSAASMLRTNKHSAEPWCELLVAGQIVLAQGAHTEELSVGEGDKREWQGVGVHVGAKLSAARLDRLIA